MTREINNDIISEEELIDMFGEGGAEEVKECFSGESIEDITRTDMKEKGCEKEIEVKYGTILGTSETCKTKCGWWCDGEQRYCEECKECKKLLLTKKYMNKFKTKVLEKLDIIISILGKEAPSKTQVFEDSNFRIDSKGWKQIEGKKENPKGDVWELIEGEFKGEQLFTWDSAMRETKKVGKKLPTRQDFEENIKTVEDVRDWKKVGYRYSNATLSNQGTYGFYWSSDPNGTYAFYLNFYSTGVYPANYYDRAYGFSVRCLKN